MSDQPTMTNEELGLEPEVEIEIAEPDATPAPPPEIKPEEGIEELRAKLLAEQRAREQLEEQAARATHAAQHAFSEKEQSDIALVQSALQHIEGEEQKLEDSLAAALQSGDSKRAAKLMLESQKLASNRQQLEQGLEALSERAQQARRAPPPAPPQQRTDDPVEVVARNLTPASAKWVRAHPEYATDESKRNKMVGAHYEAVSEGIKADSPEYFEFVERKLGIEAEPEQRQPAQRAPAPRPQPPAAPARGNGGQTNTRLITLSAQQREIARMSGQTDEEYARELTKLRAEGRIGTSH